MGAIGRFYRRVEEGTGIANSKRHKHNRVVSGIARVKPRRISNSLIYGFQLVNFDNSVPKKEYQVGPNYSKFVPNIRPADLSGYKKLRSGSLVKVAAKCQQKQ